MFKKIVTQNSQIQISQYYKESPNLKSLAEEEVHIFFDAERSRIDKLRNELPYMTTLWNMIPYGESYNGFPPDFFQLYS